MYTIFAALALGLTARPIVPLALTPSICAARVHHPILCRLPAGVAEATSKWSDKYKASEIDALWKAVRKCYPTEAAAVQAVQQNANVVCPLFATPALIQKTYSTLIEVVGKEDTIEVLRLNPSVLTCGEQLRGTGSDEILKAAKVRRALDAIPSEAVSVGTALVVAAIAYRLSAGVGP